MKLIPLDPFYRLHFPDGTYFDYKDDPEHLEGEVARLAPEDLEATAALRPTPRPSSRRAFWNSASPTSEASWTSSR